ncbi:MAG TPA: 2-oxoglutarate dehydrogenase E1 component [Terriglobales bacterium]|nr:2-oxoglutarate dehydrogenase E1 component [Terriglobales bacterium]
MATRAIRSDKNAPAEREVVFDVFRRWGYLEANLDPLGHFAPQSHPELESLTGASAEEARRYYCGSVGAEFMHMADPERRHWIEERMESDAPAAEDADHILERLISAELFEQVLQTRYLGTKRYSLEGNTALIPLLDEMLETGSGFGAEEALIAMAHRGRLNAIVHIAGRPARDVFAGFEDVDPRSVLGSGDVKYHLGATGQYQTRSGRTVRIHLVSNPSHLEAVDPVAVGRLRAKQIRLGEDGQARSIAFLLHGDAAFAGQGVTAETLAFSGLRGYDVGGVVHVIVNNLIGFTTNPSELHSSRFSADLAKRLPVPIFHVNAEDLDAVARVARMAMDYRYEFGTDVVVDLIGYRRHGHSEVDDPTVTQPRLYRRIKEHPVAWQVYATKMGADAEPVVERVRAQFEEAQKQAAKLTEKPVLAQLPAYWSGFKGGSYDPAYEVDTGVTEQELREVTDGLTQWPAGFHIHPKVQKLLEQRAEMGYGKRPVDFGMAEALAFGTLVRAGVPVRLSGQDSRRGTFNQRHSVLIDTEDEHEHIPLNHLSTGQARFEVYNSILSENAVLGFEYGYSRDFPEALVLWEAQFGDFANGAQVIIDQFISAGEDKWGLMSGLVLLLPHGFEGQGPEHSSARIERYLQLAARDNIQVCQPSTAAQYFHLLRRQALRPWRKPLVVFTPKSMLRHPDASSPVGELSRSRLQIVIGDPEVENAESVLLCTGKIGHELRRERRERGAKQTAIVFLEQLYPFPHDELAAELARHSQARDLVWVQEEPANQGALGYMMPRLTRMARDRHVRTVKRSPSPSPATGSAKAHELEQKALVALAFTR